MINYLKRHLIISLILSTLLTIGVGVYHYFTHSCYLEFSDICLYFFGSFGAFTLFNVVALLFFPNLVMTDEDIEDDSTIQNDSANFIEVYFYEGFSEGVSRVVKIFGDPRYKNNLQREFNFINEDGNFVFDQWFLSAETFKEGRTIVMDRNFKFNIGTIDGKLLCGNGYTMMSRDWSDGKVKVGDGEGNVNFVRISDGSLVWSSWRLEQVNYGEE